MPDEPVLIYDGHCGFCKIWLEFAQALLGDTVEWLPSQQIGERFPQVDRADLPRFVFFVSPAGTVSHGAAAVCELLALSPRYHWPRRLFRHLPPFAWLANLVYGYIARHRGQALVFTQLTFGPRIQPLAYDLTENLFLRLLGLISLTAFVSLRMQILGLAGSHGIVPAAQMMNAMRAAVGSRAMLIEPSIF